VPSVICESIGSLTSVDSTICNCHESCYCDTLCEEEKAEERQILQTFYTELNGTSWISNDNWTMTGEADVCTFFGVTCNDVGNVKELYFSVITDKTYISIVLMQM